MEAMGNERVKVLIVDDMQENMEIIGNVLESEGYDLYIADSGFIAIELVEKNDFDLILLDIMMPDMDGFQTISEIRRIRPDEDIPVIFLTAKADIDSVIRGFEMGAADYVRKPFNNLELKARVKYQVELKKMKKELESKNRELEVANERLKQQANTDALTQLCNRREVSGRIKTEHVRFDKTQKSFSIILCDIDHFRKINDAYGYDAGDDVMKHIAALLKTVVRNQDTVARWGGETFIVLLPETELSVAMVVAEKLRVSISEVVVRTDTALIAFTMTFGVSCFSVGKTVEEVIALAEEAMLKGKKQSRNCVVVASQ